MKVKQISLYVWEVTGPEIIPADPKHPELGRRVYGRFDHPHDVLRFIADWGCYLLDDTPERFARDV